MRHLRGGRDPLPAGAGGCTRPVTATAQRRSGEPGVRPRRARTGCGCMDITEHPTDEGKVYLAVGRSTPRSRRVVGWSIADHIRAELVADALQMATWRRRPPSGQTIAHSDHGGQYTSLAVRQPPPRTPACSARWAASATASTTPSPRRSSPSLQRELLDQHHWPTRDQLAAAIFEWIESLVQPAPPPQLQRRAQPHRLRDRQRGMITTPTPSVEPGYFINTSVKR